MAVTARKKPFAPRILKCEEGVINNILMYSLVSLGPCFFSVRNWAPIEGVDQIGIDRACFRV